MENWNVGLCWTSCILAKNSFDEHIKWNEWLFNVRISWRNQRYFLLCSGMKIIPHRITQITTKRQRWQSPFNIPTVFLYLLMRHILFAIINTSLNGPVTVNRRIPINKYLLLITGIFLWQFKFWPTSISDTLRYFNRQLHPPHRGHRYEIPLAHFSPDLMHWLILTLGPWKWSWSMYYFFYCLFIVIVVWCKRYIHFLLQVGNG